MTAAKIEARRPDVRIVRLSSVAQAQAAEVVPAFDVPESASAWRRFAPAVWRSLLDARAIAKEDR